VQYPPAGKWRFGAIFHLRTLLDFLWSLFDILNNQGNEDAPPWRNLQGDTGKRRESYFVPRASCLDSKKQSSRFDYLEVSLS
jgi:hypothetical protein